MNPFQEGDMVSFRTVMGVQNNGTVLASIEARSSKSPIYVLISYGAWTVRRHYSEIDFVKVDRL